MQSTLLDSEKTTTIKVRDDEFYIYRGLIGYGYSAFYALADDESVAYPDKKRAVIMYCHSYNDAHNDIQWSSLDIPFDADETAIIKAIEVQYWEEV